MPDSTWSPSPEAAGEGKGRVEDWKRQDSKGQGMTGQGETGLRVVRETQSRGGQNRKTVRERNGKEREGLIEQKAGQSMTSGERRQVQRHEGNETGNSAEKLRIARSET